MNILVTGGYGFIGSNLIKYLLKFENYNILNIDKLTHGSNLNNLDNEKSDNYSFAKVDLCNLSELKHFFMEFQPDMIMHLAAESHVDRSISDPGNFIKTNIMGTYNLLELTREYLGSHSKEKFRFLHVSTDEVFGDLTKDEPPFKEDNNYAPSSPYSASKASSDHLVRAWNRTYGLPVLISNCSNNYGPNQHFEKMIPTIISSCILGEKIPVYGDGSQIRDWLYVVDHVEALHLILTEGSIGESYNVGGNNEISNIELVRTICNLLDQEDILKPNKVNSFLDLIRFVKDRPGHDQRYAIDSSKIAGQLNWTPNSTFEDGIKKTIKWYLDNKNYLRK